MNRALSAHEGRDSMGSTSWSNKAYEDRASTRAATGTPTFAHTAAVKSGAVAAKAVTKLDPMGLKVRESRDSATHPISNGIIVVTDQTGSMGAVIMEIQKALPKFMTVLNAKGIIEGPQILISAIGDSRNGEKVPLQVGQFEAGIEVEDDITSLFIEGNGGGNFRESYELMAYVAAYHTSMDCLEKRNRKGYIFFIGDELTYDDVSRGEVNRLMGTRLEKDIPIAAVFAKLQEQFHTFFILPKGASHGGDKSVIAHWKKLVGEENVIELDDASAISETMALQIGLCEGSTDVDSASKDLVDSGSSTALVRTAVDSINPKYRTGSAIARATPGGLATSGTDSVGRI